MTQTQRYPSYAECVTKALSGSLQPMSVESLLTEVGGQRPLGKGARSAVYRAISQIFQAVPVGPGRFGWLSHLLTGSVFRHPLSTDEIRRGFLLLDELEHIAFFPQFFQAHRPDDRGLKIELFGGPTIEADVSIERKTWSLRLGPEFAEWVNILGGQGKDDLLIYVVDASKGEYQVRMNLREMRDERAIRQNNIRLALNAEELVANYRRTPEAMPTWELVARLIGRGVFHATPPADDFHYVLHEYSMLRFRDGTGYVLAQADQDIVSGTTLQDIPDDTGDPSRSDHDWRLVLFNHAADDDSSDRAGTPDLDAFSREQSHDLDQEYAAMQDDDPIGPDEECADYQAYLQAFQADRPGMQPLSHEDFHLLEAELEMMVRLEEEFGHLLREQYERKEYLAALLYIDPSEFIEDDWDMPGGPETFGPFWTN